MSDEARDYASVVLKKAAAGSFRLLQRCNILYLLSALLMLLGCYLISMPYLFRRELSGLPVLLGVINVYEAMVILAFAFIMRRARASREAPVLLLVELLFMLDVTFTINACMPIRFGVGLAIGLSSLALAFVKLRALEIGARRKVFDGLGIVLIPALVFTYTFQSVLVLTRHQAEAVRAAAAYPLWLAFGAMPMLLLLARFGPRSAEDAASRISGTGEVPWLGATFRKAVAAVVLSLVGIQVVGQTWVHRAPFSMSFLLPLAFSVMAAFPALLRVGNRRALNAARAAATGFLVVLSAFVAEEMPWTATLFGHGIVLSPLRIGLAFGAAALFVMWRREKSADLFHGAFTLLALASLGHSGGSMIEALVRPSAWHVAAISALAIFWFSQRRTYLRALVAVSPVLFAAFRTVELAQPQFVAWIEFVRYWPLAAFALGLVFPRELPSWRRLLTFVLLAAGLASCAPTDALSLAYFGAVFGALVAALLVTGRPNVYVVAGYLVAAHLRVSGVPVPRTPVEWGGLAFASFAAAFLITRARISRPAARENAGSQMRAAHGGSEVCNE